MNSQLYLQILYRASFCNVDSEHTHTLQLIVCFKIM